MSPIRHVILAFDPLDLAQAVSSRVREEGREVSCCGSGQESRGRLFDADLELLVVGEVLVDALGAELIGELRDAGRETPALLLARRELDPPQAERLRASSVTEVLVAPLDADAIAAAVARMLSAPRARPSSGLDRADVAQALAALREEFARALPARMTELIDSLDRARASTDAIGDARALAHKLVGTAGSYGWRALSSALSAVEAELSRGTAPDWERIDASVDAAFGALSEVDRRA